MFLYPEIPTTEWFFALKTSSMKAYKRSSFMSQLRPSFFPPYAQMKLVYGQAGLGFGLNNDISSLSKQSCEALKPLQQQQHPNHRAPDLVPSCDLSRLGQMARQGKDPFHFPCICNRS